MDAYGCLDSSSTGTVAGAFMHSPLCGTMEYQMHCYYNRCYFERTVLNNFSYTLFLKTFDLAKLSVPFRDYKIAPINSVSVTAFLANLLNFHAAFTKSFIPWSVLVYGVWRVTSSRVPHLTHAYLRGFANLHTPYFEENSRLTAIILGFGNIYPFLRIQIIQENQGVINLIVTLIPT